MTSFKKFAPVVALAFALSPFAAGAVTTQDAPHKDGYSTAISQFAANSKGRPGENQTAANSKGRPGEQAQLAENSRGRPGETTQSAPETPFG